MQVAQKLYEGINIGGETVGLITYMRTDGVHHGEGGRCSPPARLIGSATSATNYLPDSAAHVQVQGQERPGSPRSHPPDRPVPPEPNEMAGHLDSDDQFSALRADLEAHRGLPDGHPLCSTRSRSTSMPTARTAQLRATGSVVAFDGFLKLYQEGKRRPSGQRRRQQDEAPRRLPKVTEGERVTRSARHRDARTALHPAAAALHRGQPGEDAGGTGHRPPLHLRLHHLQVLQDRNYVKPREAAASFRKTAAAWSSPSCLSEFFDPLRGSTTSPPRWRSSLDDISGGRIDWRTRTAAISGTAFHSSRWTRRQRSLGCTQVIDALDDGSRPTLLPGRPGEPGARTRAPAPPVSDGRLEPAPGQERRLRRLLQLSGLPLYPTASP